MGELLWEEAKVDADVVIPVPDSGNAAARGLARASGLPQDDGFIKNRYVARTFIQPGQELRKLGVRLKFNPVPEVVAGKRVIVVDDSIVRGTTDRQIVQMLRDAGAAEVHLRISAPPIRNPCHYGIDMSSREEMIAHGRTVERDRRRDRCRLAALPLARGRLRGDPRGSRRHHCDACFSGRVSARGDRGARRQIRARAGAAAAAGVVSRACARSIARHPITLAPGRDVRGLTVRPRLTGEWCAAHGRVPGGSARPLPARLRGPCVANGIDPGRRPKT